MRREALVHDRDVCLEVFSEAFVEVVAPNRDEAPIDDGGLGVEHRRGEREDLDPVLEERPEERLDDQLGAGDVAPRRA